VRQSGADFGAEPRNVSLAPSYHALRWPEGRARLNPVVLLHVSLLLLVVTNLGRIPVLDLGDREAPILVNDLGVGLAIVSGFFVASVRRSLFVDWVTLAGLLFASIGFLSAVSAGPRFGLSAFEVLASLAYLARWLMYFAFYIVVVNVVRPAHVEGLWRSLERAMLVFAAFGIVQAIFLPNFAFIVYPDQAWDAQRHRLVSTVLEPNVAAAMLVIILLVQLSQLATGVKIAAWKPALILVALVMTLSRSGIAGFLMGGLVLFAARGLSRRVMRFGFFSFLAALAALPLLLPFAADYNKLGISDASAASRLITWQRAIAAWWESPWFGIGFNTWGFVQERRGFERMGGSSYSAEGGLLFIAVMTGIVGLAVFCLMLWLVVKRCRAAWRDARATPFERSIAIGAAASTVAVCVHSVFVNSLTVPFVMQPLFLLWGLVYVARRRMREGPGVA
jgi:O-antigen ligase